MKTKVSSVEKLVEEHVRKWEILRRKKKQEVPEPVITVSRLPGSGGRLIVRKIADEMDFDLFDSEIVQKIAESARVSSTIVETLDEKGRSAVEDWLSALVNDRYFWDEGFVKHLAKVLNVIGKHGKAVILGRGASFILPPAECVRVLVLAPFEVRIQNIIREFSASAEEARRRVMRTESERKAFIRKYFHAEMTDPTHFDLVLNTEFISIHGALEIIKAAWNTKRARLSPTLFS
jgi:cytidylate kinase